MSTNDDTAPGQQVPAAPTADVTQPIASTAAGSPAFAPVDAAQAGGTGYGSAPPRSEAAPSPYGWVPQDGQPMGYGTAPQYGPVPTAASAPSRPSRRSLGIVAAVIGGVLLVGAGFGTGLIVGHRTARWDGPTGLLSRVDQRGELRGPGYGSGEQLRPFGGHGRRGDAEPAPAVPTPAPTS